MEKYFSLAMLICLALLLNQCNETPQVQPMATDEEIANTTIEVFYDPDTVIVWDEPTFPLTLTCELRRDSDGAVVASQTLTWTVPVHSGYITEPIQMVEPISLTWPLEKPLEPGLYKEFCQGEIDGHYGRSDPGTEYDDRQFYKANEWPAGTCWGVLFRGVAK